MIPSREGAHRFVACALAGLTLPWSAASLAEDGGAWPARTIQIVVPYTPGTGADILARILGPKLAERWKVGVVTDNRPTSSRNPRPTAIPCFARQRLSAPIPRSIESCPSIR